MLHQENAAKRHRKEITGVRIKLASPDRIRELSSGEVKKPETINYRTLRPEKDGLFCERIFGPTRSFECACGKYKRSGPKFKGVVCDRCGVEVTDNRVRRERMGHIELAAPVVHIWFLRGIPSRLSLLLGTTTKDLEKVVYFAPARRREPVYKVVVEGRKTGLVRKGEIISASEERVHAHYDKTFKAEEAYRVVQVDDVPVEPGDVLSSSQVARYKGTYGDDAFRVEPAFRVLESDPGGNFEEKQTLSRSELEALKGKGMEPPVERETVGNQDAFKVVQATHMPFGKGDLISISEYQLYHEKYAGRFVAQVETITLEDPCYIVISKGDSPFEDCGIIMEREYRLCISYDKKFSAGIGAEGVQDLLGTLDMDELALALREEITDASGQKKRKLVKRLNVAEDFRKSRSNPGWMVLQVLPVIPPDLRPMVQLDGGRFATSDLNDLYRRVINRNNRLKKLQELHAPEIIVRNEKRMLQESVDALIDNGRVGKAVLGAGNRPLKSLSDLLRGKKGRFRQNLLGKRVDYSGRSVIVIGPNLKLHQCGLPKQMALELFKPFVMQKLVDRGNAPNVKSARRLIERGREEVWGILEEIIRDHPVLLNRAPTLHRLGIQAFEPVLMEGKAIRLHPLVCTAFNADFDGDQMAVHVPLSLEAQAEARLLMLSSHNLLSPASGRSIVTPTQDIVLGIYYLTGMRERDDVAKDAKLPVFRDIEDCLVALSHGVVHINSLVKLKWKDQWLETSPGRALFNSVLPEEIRYVNRQMDKKELARLLDEAYDRVSREALVRALDDIKSLGYRWATKSGISMGLGDVVIPEEKGIIVQKTMDHEADLSSQYQMGILTEEEYLWQKEILWTGAARDIADHIVDSMSEKNSLRMMVDSGARGSRGQVAQMAGIRGLMADPSGRIIDYPITANFKEGLNMLEYFISTHGARKGLADTALRTAKSGYLTRRLVDVAQDIIVTEEDCGTMRGVTIRPLTQDGKTVIGLGERIVGRVPAKDIVHPETGEVLAAAGIEISQISARAVEKSGLEEVVVRSPLTCELKNGVCRACYGLDLATRKRVAIGEAVGVVAAQSIGEPGTQLTMRTFHTGGVRITGEDITQGLPRIEQLFEVRRPKKVAFLSKIEGVVSEIREMEGKRKVIVTSNEEGKEQKVQYNIPLSQNLLVEEGQTLRRGDRLTEGHEDPQDILECKDMNEVQRYLVDNIQDVYKSQGVSINNKHIEVILRKVAPENRVRVTEEGSSSYVANDLVWKDDLEADILAMREENERFLQEAESLLCGAFLVDVEGSGNIEQSLAFKGDHLEAKSIRRLLLPGNSLSSLLVRMGTEEMRIVVGEAAFRREMEGRELLEAFHGEENIVVEPTASLTSGQLAHIVKGNPQAIRVRNSGILAKMSDAAWLAEEIRDSEGRVVLSKDAKINEATIALLREHQVETIKIWKTPQEILVDNEIQKHLISYYEAPLSQVIDVEGAVLQDIPPRVDARIVRGLAEGEFAGVEVTLNGERIVLTREKALREVLQEFAYGKVLLDALSDAQGDVLLASGSEVNKDVLETLVQLSPSRMVLRSPHASGEGRRLIEKISFVRRLGEEPTYMPLLHGITKAALATESFLSAASFQQTAQVLARAAVRSEEDTLRGLKENVIIGHLMPAGTGVDRYRKLMVSPAPPERPASPASGEAADLQERPIPVE